MWRLYPDSIYLLTLLTYLTYLPTFVWRLYPDSIYLLTLLTYLTYLLTYLRVAVVPGQHQRVSIKPGERA